MSELSSTFTDKLFADFQADSKLCAVENAVTHNGLLKSLETRQSEMENGHAFSIDLTKDKVANQKASGRCWMFAALNTFRHKMISDLNLEDFELSQAHTFFWDKYEKSNWFLEQVIATADQELGSRKVKFLLDVPQQDGGQWDMVVALFEKYGVVPKVAYPESISSSNSRELNQYLNKLLRQDAQILREAIAAGADEKAVQAKIDKFMSIQGKESVDSIHKKLGHVMWEYVGMGRTAEGLKKGIAELKEIRKEFETNLFIPGSKEGMNVELDKAIRLYDFITMGELVAYDALNRNESCGGHFREEYQTEEGEAKRDDENFFYVACWEYQGDDEKAPVLHKEPLVYEAIKVQTRNYKS